MRISKETTNSMTKYVLKLWRICQQRMLWLRSPFTINRNKYQLLLIDPRDGILLQTELDDHCDKLQRSSVGARRCCQLSWPTSVQFITLWASTFLELSRYHVSTIDMRKHNCLSPQFGRNFQSEIPLFWRYLNFLLTQCDRWKEARLPKTSSIRSAASIEHRLVTDRQTDRQTQGHS